MFATVVFLLVAVRCTAAPGENVLIIIADDVGVDKLSSYDEAGACSISETQCRADAVRITEWGLFG